MIKYYKKLRDQHIPGFIIWGSVVIIVIIIIGLIFSICTYCYKFYGSDYSSDITLWGYFGDFWWNLIVAITSIINLIAFIFITVMVAKMQDTRSKENKEHQATLLKVQIKMDNINDLRMHINYLLAEPLEINVCAKTSAVLESFKNTSLNIFFKNAVGAGLIIDEIVSIIDNRNKERYDYVNEFIPKKDQLISVLLQSIQQDFNK